MEWINVNERYPENGQKIIFYVENRNEFFCGFYEDRPTHRNIDSKNRNIFYENLDNWWFEDEKITYWMPLLTIPNQPERSKREDEVEKSGKSEFVGEVRRMTRGQL
jgi:hypothetical protein